MKEVFEKIIEKLEDKRKTVKQLIMENPQDELDKIQTQAAEDFASAYKDAIEIVKQEAEKFGNDINVGSNGWISCSERLPEPIRPVLVTLRNWMNDKYFVRVGRFHTDHWKTDEGIVKNSIVIAWQPLPQPYQPKGE